MGCVISYKGVDYVVTSTEGKSILNLDSYSRFNRNDETTFESDRNRYLFVIDQEYLDSLEIEVSDK